MATMVREREQVPDGSAQKAAPSPSEGRSGELTIRIFTYPQGECWYAEATDLALLAEGPDEPEAIRRLIDLVVAYVRTALSHGWFDQLRRQASLRHRLEVQVRVGLAKLRRQPARIRTQLVAI